jgi:putative RNA 2'-phosphotransferase
VIAADRDIVQISKFLSLVLRHEPEIVGQKLDKGGWLEVADLIRGAKAAGVDLTPEILACAARGTDKKRFTLSEDGLRIKANYGHSIPVDLDLEPAEPPELLFHGTAARFLDPIRDEGISRRGRHYVHLSGDEASAVEIGKRHGEPVVLKVQAGRMHREGYEFFLSESGIWLTRSVPPNYVEFPGA